MIRNYWGRERPSSTESENSAPADIEPAIRQRRRRRPAAKIEPQESTNDNNNLSLTIITVLVSIIIGLSILLVQVNNEKELNSCQSILSINETFIRQLESENEHYARQHNSCIDSLQSSEKQIIELKIENRQHESEKQKNEKNQKETEKKLDLAEKKLNLLKIDIKGQESETKKIKSDYEETKKKLQLAEEKGRIIEILAEFGNDESEVTKELIKLKKELKDIKNEKIELKSKYEAAERKSKKSSLFKSPLLTIIILVSKFVLFYTVLLRFPIDTHMSNNALTEKLLALIFFDFIFCYEVLGCFLTFVFAHWVIKNKSNSN